MLTQRRWQSCMRPEPLNRPTLTIDRQETVRLKIWYLRTGHLSLFVSLLLHGLAGLVLLSIMPKLLEDVVTIDEIEVEIIPPSALPKPSGIPPLDPLDQPRDPAADAARRFQSGDGMIRPEQLLSRSLLDAPENAEGRAAYDSMTGGEQRDQLCNLEVLEQIKALGKGHVPLWMNAFAIRPVVYEGKRMIANGAAFFSNEKWHRVKFECELSDDGKSIVDFAFQIGVIVPRDDWDRHGLTPVNGLAPGH